MLLEMVAEAAGDRVAVGPRDGGLTYRTLLEESRRTATWLRNKGVANVAMVGPNSEVIPLLMFGSALAGMPFAPVNYRLGDEQLGAILQRLAPALAVVDDDVVGRLGEPRRRRCHDHRRVRRRRAAIDTIDECTGRSRGRGHPAVHQRDDRRAEGGRAPPSPPHLLHPVDGRVPRRRRRRGAAGQRARRTTSPAISAVLSSVFAGRRICYLPAFDAPGLGAGGRHRGDHPGDGRADDARTHPRRDRAHRAVAPGAAPRLLRRRADAGPGDRAGDGHAAPA